MNKNLVGSLPIKPLADAAPEYSRPSKKLKNKNKTTQNKKKLDLKKSLIKILGSPNHSSKKWIFSQYDSTVMGDTIFSSEQSDAAVINS